MVALQFGYNKPSLFSGETRQTRFFVFTWELPEKLSIQVNLGILKEKIIHFVLVGDCSTLCNLDLIEQSDQYKSIPIIIPDFYAILPGYADKIARLQTRRDIVLLPFGADWAFVHENSLNLQFQALPLDATMTTCVWKVGLYRPASEWLHAPTSPKQPNLIMPSRQQFILAHAGYCETTPINSWLQHLTPTAPAVMFLPMDPNNTVTAGIKGNMRQVKETLADLIRSLIPRQCSIMVVSDDPLTTFFALCEFSVTQVHRLPSQYICKVATFGWPVHNALAALDSATILSLKFGIGDVFNVKNPSAPHHHLQLISDESLVLHTSHLKASLMIENEPTIVFILGDPSIIADAMTEAIAQIDQTDSDNACQKEHIKMSASSLNQQHSTAGFAQVFKAFLRRSADMKVVIDLNRFEANGVIRQVTQGNRDILRTRLGTELVLLDWEVQRARQKISSEVILESDIRPSSTEDFNVESIEMARRNNGQRSTIADVILEKNALSFLTCERETTFPLAFVTTEESLLSEPSNVLHWKSSVRQLEVTQRVTTDVHNLQSIL